MANLFRSDKKGSGGIQVESLTITTMPTKTSYSINDTLDLSGLVVTATFADGITADVTSAITTSPADGDTLTIEGTIPVTVIYQNATTSFNITCSALPASLEDATWAQIQAAVQNGTLSQFASVGDTKSFVINGKTYHAELVSINDGTGSASSWYPDNTIDFICEELYEATYRYNSSDNNSGGFPSSEIKDTMNNTIYPLFPTDLKDVIIDKSHSYQAGSKSGTQWISSMITLSTKLWLPTHYEIVGTTHSYAVGETSSNNKAYILASRSKMLNGQTSATSWWTGSPSSAESDSFWFVDANTNLYDGRASVVLGVPLCFRIG